MAIQIGGTTVIDNSRNIENVRSISAGGEISGNIRASKDDAVAASSHSKIMTPLRVKEAIEALGGNMINKVIRGTSTYYHYRTSWGANTNAESNKRTIDLPNGQSVNTLKSFITQGNRGEIDNASNGAGTGSGAARLASSTTIDFIAGEAAYRGYRNTGYVEWTLVEFK